MSEPRNLRVFLCHASQDKPIVRELYQRLLAEGWIDPWLDEEKLLPGQDWDMEIEKAVEAADAVIVCLSNRSVSKEGYIQRELKFVLDIALEKPEGTIFVVPLRLDDCELPRRLRSWQFVDYFPAERRKPSYQRLIQSLKLRLVETQRRMRDEEHPAAIMSASSAGTIEEKAPAAVQMPEQLTVTLPTTPSGMLELGWSVLPILFFATIGIFSFGYTDSDFTFLIGVVAILTGSILALKRQIVARKSIIYSIILFIVAHSLLIYSDYSGWELSPILTIIDGVAAVLSGGLLVLNFRSPRKQATYSAIFFALFIFLFGVKLILNFFNIYSTEIQTPIIVIGVIACLFLWLEQ